MQSFRLTSVRFTRELLLVSLVVLASVALLPPSSSAAATPVPSVEMERGFGGAFFAHVPGSIELNFKLSRTVVPTVVPVPMINSGGLVLLSLLFMLIAANVILSRRIH